MHQVDEDGEDIELRNLKVQLKPNSIRPRDEYFEHLDALCDPRAAPGPVQFTSDVGLGRVFVTGAGLASVATLHLVWLLGALASLWHGQKGPWTVLWAAWSAYAVALCVYHSSEFVVTMRYNGSVASCESFLLNQSRAYQVALLCGWVEFWVEALLAPQSKSAAPMRLGMGLGLGLVVLGQTFRTGAMVSAQSNFTHLIQFEKTKSHRLVTDGLYKLVRHPSYFGWFWWSIGTQLLLGNPVCLVAYAAAAYKFFEQRIPVEERTLVEFFPDQYPAYRARTPVGIPFLR